MSFSIVAEGTPEDVAKVQESYTGKYLRDLLARRPAASGRLRAPAPGGRLDEGRSPGAKKKAGRLDEGRSPAATKKSNGRKQAAE